QQPIYFICHGPRHSLTAASRPATRGRLTAWRRLETPAPLHGPRCQDRWTVHWGRNVRTRARRAPRTPDTVRPAASRPPPPAPRRRIRGGPPASTPPRWTAAGRRPGAGRPAPPAAPG